MVGCTFCRFTTPTSDSEVSSGFLGDAPEFEVELVDVVEGATVEVEGEVVGGAGVEMVVSFFNAPSSKTDLCDSRCLPILVTCGGLFHGQWLPDTFLASP